ncbi:MAG: transposase family protein [Planctomycetes bacterium]|nr:transposase family protein [Planctomycetota bacterium]
MDDLQTRTRLLKPLIPYNRIIKKPRDSGRNCRSFVAKEAERALEEACIARLGTLRVVAEGPVVRSDNGLIFQIRRVGPACRFDRLRQEYITPYRPEQNTLIERFFRSFKEECVWQHHFESFEEARRVIRQWVRLVQRRPPATGAGQPQPSPVPGSPTQIGGLT